MQRQYLASIAALVLTILLATAGYRAAVRYETVSLERDLLDRLSLTQHSISTEIERFRYLPAVVAQDPRIGAMLARPDGAMISEANTYLQAVRDLSGVDELYVLNARGVTLAASNWNRPDGFVGHDYSFRPYFRDALAQGEGRYYAVGVTTGKPGYFLSLRLGSGPKPMGVVVVKVDMAPLENAWGKAADRVALVDAVGIVFLAGQPAWRYRPLYALSGQQLADLHSERRYDGLKVETSAPLLATDGTLHDARGTLRIARGIVNPDGWQVVVAAPLAPVQVMAATIAALIVLIGATLTGLGLILWQRRQLIRIRLDQADELEKRVTERTLALAHEVEERRLAQDELRRTHAALVHAAKLAVLGRMSATIVHEVSQPLSALDATLAAAGLHMQRGNTERAQTSLGSARGLIRRMQDMVRALKMFGVRQKPAPPEPVAVDAALNAALEILSPRLRELHIPVERGLPADLPPVSGNSGQMQQVLTNLVLNAAEATAGAGRTEPLRIEATFAEGRLYLSIYDRGPGISNAMREQVFEPFFTTRVTGEGLGLGLSIVRSILEGMGGQLSFRGREGGGTETLLDLPLFGMTRERI